MYGMIGMHVCFFPLSHSERNSERKINRGFLVHWLQSSNSKNGNWSNVCTIDITSLQTFPLLTELFKT